MDAEVSSAMKPSPSALMLAAGLATAQSTLRDPRSSAGADDLHYAPSTELQAGYALAHHLHTSCRQPILLFAWLCIALLSGVCTMP